MSIDADILGAIPSMVGNTQLAAVPAAVTKHPLIFDSDAAVLPVLSAALMLPVGV